MTMLSENKFECDKCGADCGNGGVLSALVLSDIDPDRPGHVRNLHFCRDREDKDGNKIKGCDNKVLSTTNLKHLKEKKNA